MTNPTPKEIRYRVYSPVRGWLTPPSRRRDLGTIWSPLESDAALLDDEKVALGMARALGGQSQVSKIEVEVPR